MILNGQVDRLEKYLFFPGTELWDGLIFFEKSSIVSKLFPDFWQEQDKDLKQGGVLFE